MKMDVMSMRMLASNDISPTSMYHMCIPFVAPVIVMLVASVTCRLHLRMLVRVVHHLLALTIGSGDHNSQ